MGRDLDPEEVGDPHQPGPPIGHFYSPIPLISEVRRREAKIFTNPPLLRGINLNVPQQLALLSDFRHYYAELPFEVDRRDGLTYHFDNAFFSYGDAIALYSMIRHLTPRRIVEVGSGFSSCAILDINRLFFADAIRCTHIDPYPTVFDSALRLAGGGSSRLMRQKVQSVDLPFFSQLESGDVLFIDSTHVAKVGSDVNYLIFEVFPALKEGVFIHIHDIFYPFEYPKAWIYRGRAWNEAYLVRAFLEFNAEFHIVYFLDYVARFHRPKLELATPLSLNNTGGGLWLRKGRGN